MKNNQVMASTYAGILFGFTALLLLWNKSEPLYIAMLGISAILMTIHAMRLRGKKSTCISKIDSNEN